MLGWAQPPVLAVIAALAGPAAQAPAPGLPAPDAPLPRTATGLAAAYETTSGQLDEAIDRWIAEGDPSRGGAPRDVQLLSLHEQRIQRFLVPRRALLRSVLGRLDGRVRAEVRDEVLAQRELAGIHSVAVGPTPRVRLGPALPADVLRRHYRAAWRRFGVGPPLLAAVNYVESHFGRLRNSSISGAQGPMQFIPSTWAAYGMGGNIRDPRDAILGAANLLHANGAPRDERRALFRYNPSSLYVSSVARYTRRIRSDERALYALYARQVFYRGRLRTAPPPP